MSVFISYAREDEAFARELSLELIRENAKVWRDEYRLRAGDVLQESLFAAIRSSKLFVVLVSKAAAKSNWVALETVYALEREAQDLIEIVPVRLDDGGMLTALSGRVYSDGRKGASAIAAALAPRARDAASPPLAGQRVSDDARCYTHYGQDAGLDEEGRFRVRLDIVSFDLDCPYSILSEFNFVSAEPALDATPEEARALAQQLIEACAQSARSEPWRVKLNGGEARTGAFSIDCGWTKFAASYRIARIGKVDRGAVVFNAGALFELIADPARPDA